MAHSTPRSLRAGASRRARLDGAPTRMPVPPTPAVVDAVVRLAGLTAALTVKHVLADFVMQSNWMARGKEATSAWTAPLLAHVACHAALTLLVALAVRPTLWWLALVDLAVHATVDRGKALFALRVRWRMDQPQFWWLLGIDQGLHQLTNIGLATALILL